MYISEDKPEITIQIYGDTYVVIEKYMLHGNVKEIDANGNVISEIMFYDDGEERVLLPIS